MPYKALVEKEVLLKPLELDGFSRYESSISCYATIHHVDAGLKIQACWDDGSFENDSFHYTLQCNIEDISESHPEELQDILNSVESYEATDTDGEVILKSSQYIEIIAAAKKFIYL
ncbi:hypothetical protein NVP1031O_013 [Vibrio phage 1.031.O._10N.261.46.F8]|nr:hypothetical protein NVP1031O_013 [Vibrio phage 1.031.O._10N.261.46.F8]